MKIPDLDLADSRSPDSNLPLPGRGLKAALYSEWPVFRRISIASIAENKIKAKQEGGLASAIKESLPSDVTISLVRSQVLGQIIGLNKNKCLLTMEWDLLGFMKSQYPDNDNAELGSVITLSGTVLHAQATTCLDYAQQTWPSHGSEVVMAFQSAIDSRERRAQGFMFPDLWHHYNLSFCAFLTSASFD